MNTREIYRPLLAEEKKEEANDVIIDTMHVDDTHIENVLRRLQAANDGITFLTTLERSKPTSTEIGILIISSYLLIFFGIILECVDSAPPEKAKNKPAW